MKQEDTGLYKNVSTLGNAIALGAAILSSPLVLDSTRGFALRYLAKTWGADIASILIWILAGVEIYVIYAAVSFFIAAGLIWAMTAIAARSFRE